MQPRRNAKKEDSKDRIIRLLLEKPLTWTELLDQTGFSSETLNRHVDSLRELKIIDKQLMFGGRDRVVYFVSSNPEKFLQEFRSLAYDMSLRYLHDSQPSAYMLLKVFMVAFLRTKMQGQHVKIDFDSALINNLDNSVTPGEAKILGIPDGVKLSGWVAPFLKGVSK
jgi:DNA-binding transcriptional ArsR family regulator